MKLASLFADGAVLQQKQSINVWGESLPKQAVRGKIAGVEAYTVTSLTGEFMLRFPPMEAGGPYTLTISDMPGVDRIVINDVMVGEVWLASGQSNMEYRMKGSPGQLGEFLQQNKESDSIRMFTVGHNAMSVPEAACKGTWKKASPENVEDFSAVATWFAYKIQEQLNVPVGIIHSSWGGTAIQAWISRQTLMRIPDIHSELIADEMDNAVDTRFWNEFVYDEVSSKSDPGSLISKIAQRDHGNHGFEYGWGSPDFDDSDWNEFRVPGSWISQNISGNGAVWARFEVMIPDDWRGKDLWLDLGGIDKHDTTYFNGTEVGRSGKNFESGFWDKCRHYHIPARLVRPGRAIIAVRAYSFIYDGAFRGRIEDYQLYPDSACITSSISLAGTWNAKVEVDFGIVSIPKYLPGNPNSYSGLFNGMIRPLIPYTMRGAIWYQGESNACLMKDAERYQHLMVNLINDWREHWGQVELSFYMVNLAGYHRMSNYDGNSVWARLRESQRRACLEVSDCAMVAAVDCGEEEEIHPHNKKTVGERLARLALAKTYKITDIIPCGPIPVATTQKGNELQIDFENIADGLNFTAGKVDGFFIAGKDQYFYQADIVKINRTQIILKSSEVPEPLYVRYAWADFPSTTLSNSQNLPALPFELKLKK